MKTDLLAQVTPGPDRQSSYRPEVQGLRALAVLMVASYHIWLGKVSGGVDVFLLISAFLLSLSFIRKAEAGRALNIGRYWIHVFKRLLPAVVVVLLGVLTATALFVPKSRWSEILSQSWSSLFYVQNWALAENSVDYYATDQSVASPLQHFWSLSVQGQVFILWPLLFALATVIARIMKVRFRHAVLGVFGAVFAASFVFSIYETYTNQTYAYFDTRTRLWEFAFGTLLVLALPYIRLPRAVRIAAGWTGLAAMLSGGFILDVQGQFPGYVALWPVLAATLVILAGQTGSKFGADRFLSWKPLIRLGDMSYALYLWHWPVLIIYLIWRGREEVGPVGGTAIIGLSLILAYLTTKFVEKPLRSMAWVEKKQRRGILAIAVCLVLAAVPLAGWQGGLKIEAARLAADADRNNPGAAVLLPGYTDESDANAPTLPLPGGGEWGGSSMKTPDCDALTDGPTDDLLAKQCSHSMPEAGYDRTILVIGSSHAEHWLPAVNTMADKNGYRVISLLLTGCNFSGTESNGGESECDRFNVAALDYALTLRPDAVFTLATRSTVAGPRDVPVEGLSDTAAVLRNNGIQLVGIRDTPRFTFRPTDCAYEVGEDSAECEVQLTEVLDPTPPEGVSETDVRFVDFTDMVCPDGLCRPAIGNIFVYIDDDHLMGQYVRSAASEFERRFVEAVGW
nr:acyltransferase family protein [Arthrobacter zhangbolii]